MAVLTALDLEREAHHVWRQDRVYREEPGGRMQVHLRKSLIKDILLPLSYSARIQFRRQHSARRSLK